MTSHRHIRHINTTLLAQTPAWALMQATDDNAPAALTADVSLGRQLYERLEISVMGQNLLHDHHPEYGFPSANRAEISRSVIAKAAWRY